MWPSPAAPHRGVFVQSLATGLRQAGLDVETVALIRGQPRSLAERFVAHAGLGLRLIASTLEPADLLFVHGPSWFATLALLSARPREKGVVVHLHGGEVQPHSRVERGSALVVERFLRSADLVIAPSKNYAERAADRFDLPADRIFVSPSGGVDTDVFSPRDRAASRRRLGLWPDEPGRPVLGFVGRLEREKGTDLFVETLSRLRKAGQNVAGVVVGAGSAADTMADAALRNRVEIHFAGLLPQRILPDYYGACDALIFPTRAESLGLAAIEAMACGTPVVGAAVDAVPEYVRPGESGYLATAADVDAFVFQTERLLSAPENNRVRLRQGAVRVASGYERRAVIRDLADRLKSLAGELRAKHTYVESQFRSGFPGGNCDGCA